MCASSQLSRQDRLISQNPSVLTDFSPGFGSAVGGTGRWIICHCFWHADWLVPPLSCCLLFLLPLLCLFRNIMRCLAPYCLQRQLSSKGAILEWVFVTFRSKTFLWLISDYSVTICYALYIIHKCVELKVQHLEYKFLCLRLAPLLSRQRVWKQIFLSVSVSLPLTSSPFEDVITDLQCKSSLNNPVFPSRLPLSKMNLTFLAWFE